VRRFADLFARLDATTATSEKVAAMAEYFAATPPEDAAWALYFLTGAKLKRTAGSGVLAALVAQVAELPDWLLSDCYDHVGDLAETIALLTCRDGAHDDAPLNEWVRRLQELPSLDAAERDARIVAWWRALEDDERFLLNKLLTGALRVGVSQRLVVQALAKLSGLATDVVAHRLTGSWVPSQEFLAALLSPADESAPALGDRPYPFFLASQLDDPPESLGDARDWLAEWKWDGIRAQLIRRRGNVATWSRGEERLDGRYPEIEAAAKLLARDAVLDGEILGWVGGKPLPFTALQKRIGRLKPGPKLLADCPAVFMAYDLLELDGEDWRERPLHERRAALAELIAGTPVLLSPDVIGDGWAALAREREASRERGVEGLILKRRDSTYQVGRRRGDWWKWKVDPYTLDAVLIYSQPGHGRRSNLFTDHTFGVWHEGQLVPVAKAYSGLTDEEIGRLDRWIRANTLERFGPVRMVKPEHVFELAFEAINASARHKSGVAVRFPRIVRWRVDKPAAEADTLDNLRSLARG
jgi:DNA ligase 1